MGVKDYPAISRADVIRARHAYRSIVDLPEIERITVELFGEGVVYAPHTLAPRKGPKGAAQRIAEIWDKMTPAERDHFHQVLVAQVGEVTDTLPVDVGAAARQIVEAQAAGRVGDTRDIPGLREAVFELARCWAERGGAVIVGNPHRVTDRWKPYPLLMFAVAGVRWAMPMEYRRATNDPGGRRQLLHKDVHGQLRALWENGQLKALRPAVAAIQPVSGSD